MRPGKMDCPRCKSDSAVRHIHPEQKVCDACLSEILKTRTGEVDDKLLLQMFSSKGIKNLKEMFKKITKMVGKKKRPN